MPCLRATVSIRRPRPRPGRTSPFRWRASSRSIAVAFLGTPTGGDGTGSSTTFAGVWHLYIATTYDGGTTWTTVDATPGDPVQRGSICMDGTTCGESRNLLDFMDIAVDAEGRVLVGFADGCVGSCVSSGPNSATAIGAIARQSGGLGLFSAHD